MHPSSVANVGRGLTAWQSAATSWYLSTAIAIFSFCGKLFTYGHTNMDPHLLWKQSRSPLIIWAPAGALRKCTARSYCTPCWTNLIILCGKNGESITPESPCSSLRIHFRCRSLGCAWQQSHGSCY